MSYVSRTKQIFPLLFFVLGGSGILDGRKSGSGVRDKHPGSATLVQMLRNSAALK
jgi:hypothetical protein